MNRRPLLSHWTLLATVFCTLATGVDAARGAAPRSCGLNAALAASGPASSGTVLGPLEPPEAHAAAAREALDQGALDVAAAGFLAAANGHARRGEPGLEADALLAAAQARDASGFSGDAIGLLERALAQADAAGDTARSAVILGALARSRAALGDTPGSEQAMAEAMRRAEAASSPRVEALTLLARAELRTASGDHAAAAADYQRSASLAATAGDGALAAHAASRAVRAQLALGRTAGAGAALAQIVASALALPKSDAQAQLLLHAGRSLEQLAELEPAQRAELLPAAARAYGAATEVAAAVGARRTEAYALASLGSLHADAGRDVEALALTRRALATIVGVDAPEVQYRLQWQLGRLLRARGEREAASDAYRRAARALVEIRSHVADPGLSFDEEVEPVFLDLVDLRLQQAAATSDPVQRAALLREARDWLEELKSAELTDYFHDVCLAPRRRTQVAAIPGAVVIYPVVLPDRTELIVSNGDQITSAVVPVRAQDLDPLILRFRKLLQNRTTREYRPVGARLYDLLVRPVEAVIGKGRVDVLVFVPGGLLRTIPMSALYDDQTRQFLVEKYPIAIIPALTLTDPRALDRRNVRTLRAGLTLGVQGFPPLAAVGEEIESVESSFEGKSLMNDEFVMSTLSEALSDQEYGIVHVATHGQFASETSNSFLLTYDGKLGLDQLAVLVERTQFRDQPIELLTLSACETAAGDDRAALGLAGVAVRAGARSALATLWTVNDLAAAALISEFYRQLAQPNVSKAEALRRAQLELLRARSFRHPAYWSPFLLISNWM